MLTAWEDPSNRAPLLETITAATSDPQLRRLAAEAVEREIVIPIAERIGGKEAQHRAAAFCAQMSGILFSRYLLRIEPIASVAVDDIIKALTPSLTATLWPAAPHPSAARTRRKDKADHPPRGSEGPEPAARHRRRAPRGRKPPPRARTCPAYRQPQAGNHQSSGRAAKSRLVRLYHAIPDKGFFHLPCISFKAPLCVSSPLATISFRWLSSAFMTSLAVFPWSGKSHGPPNCLHVMVFIGPTSFHRIRPTPRTGRNG
jgi:hypothetical protein